MTSVMSRRALALALVVLACGHTSEARQRAIYEGVAQVNREHRDESRQRVLASRGAKALDVRAESLTWGEDLEWCTESLRSLPRAPPRHDVVLRRDEGLPTVTVDCDALHDAVVRGGAVVGKTEAGAGVLLVSSRLMGAGETFEVAAAADGKLLHLKPSPQIVQWREIRVPGECNRMPTVQHVPPSGSFYVLEGKQRSDLEELAYAFQGEDVRIECDSYVY
jgi:hypothetical protein